LGWFFYWLPPRFEKLNATRRGRVARDGSTERNNYFQLR